MLVRLLCIFLLASGAIAGNLSATWPAGKTEKLTYEMTNFVPAEMKNNINLEIGKSAGDNAVFTVIQTVDVPSQSIMIKATEKYNASDLKLLSAVNYFKLPPEARTQIGTDSLVITVTAVNDTLEIRSNSPVVPAYEIPMPESLTTTVGTMLALRGSDFKIGSVYKYNVINFLSLSGQKFAPRSQTDSVVSEEIVKVPMGEYKCIKVKNFMPGMYGYTYYSKENNHLPVLVEVMDLTSNQQIAKIALMKVE
jgi:hypothetical protein